MHCFDVLIAHLNQQEPPKFPSTIEKAKAPLFVTWHIEKEDMLRGCIGTFSADDIETVLPKYALISALKDSRFPPIAMKEVSGLNVAVSLLVNFQDRKDAYDWEIGKNGIIIEFSSDNDDYRATFLPEVASESNWDKDTTLKHLIKKAGYYGNYKNVINSIKLQSYESSKYKMTYQEYMKEKG